MAYPAPKSRPWIVQIEFLDGTTIDAISDDDALARWRRLASWTDATAETTPVDWMDRVLARARVFYGATLDTVNGHSPAEAILDALADADCLIVRRQT